MRLLIRIALSGTAMAAAAVLLGSCGGGSGNATDRSQALEHYRCQVAGVKRRLRGLEAGISGELPRLERCAQNALREAEGKPGRVPSLPPEPTVVGHRLGPPRIEPGSPAMPASPCQAYGKNGTTTIYVYPDSPGCARVAPGERLRVANDTGIGGPTEAVGVRVRVGDYQLWLGPHQVGLIPAPVQTYLGRGTHQVQAVGGIGPVVLLLPKACAVRPPARPGEELCFH
jgi:hypothetical protein